MRRARTFALGGHDIGRTSGCVLAILSRTRPRSRAGRVEDRVLAVIRNSACHVTRHGRLGWFLSEVLGPENVELAPNQLRRICSAFANAGIPQRSAAYPIECILVSDCKVRHVSR